MLRELLILASKNPAKYLAILTLICHHLSFKFHMLTLRSLSRKIRHTVESRI